jgi:hypothetical protein
VIIGCNFRQKQIGGLDIPGSYPNNIEIVWGFLFLLRVNLKAKPNNKFLLFFKKKAYF